MNEGPIPAHWPFIEAAYAVTLVGLLALTLAIFLQLRSWARRAREEEKS